MVDSFTVGTYGWARTARSRSVGTYGWSAGAGVVAPPPPPPPPPPVEVPNNVTIDDLNFTRGTRIRVIEDNGTRGLIGLEGVVVGAFPGSVVVKLDFDPLLCFRGNQHGGVVFNKDPRRHFRVTEVERVPREPGDPCGC